MAIHAVAQRLNPGVLVRASQHAECMTAQRVQSFVPWRHLAGGMVMVVLLTACSRRDTGTGDPAVVRGPGEAARQIAITVDRERTKLTQKKWSVTAHDSVSTLTGFAAGDTLRLIREVLDLGARGQEASRYYFVGPQLRYFESEGHVMVPNAGKPEAKHRVRLVLAFDQRGATVEATHTMDGQTAPLDSVRIRHAQVRAAELARQWATSPATAPAPNR